MPQIFHSIYAYKVILITIITQQTMRPLKSTNDHILMVIRKILRTHFTYKLLPEYFINSKFATYKMANFHFFKTATGRKPKWPLVEL